MRPDGAPAVERLRRWFLGADDAAPPATACPDRDRIFDAARGALAARERGSLLDHTVECASCAEAWRLARAVVIEAGLQPAPEVAAAAPRAWGRPVRIWGLAAAAAAVVVLAVVVSPWLIRRDVRSLAPDETPPSVFRDEGRAALAPLVPRDAVLPRDGFVLRWSPGPPGSLYDVEVVTADLRPVASVRGLDGTEYRVAAESLSALPSGSRILWRVEALLPDGTRVASQTYHVVLP